MGKKRRRKKRAFTLPIAPIAGFMGAPATREIIKAIMAGNLETALYYLPNYVGVWNDGTFHAETLAANVVPMAIGALVHKYVGGAPLNLNRTLAQAGVPVIRL